MYLKEELYNDLDTVVNIPNLIKRIKLTKTDSKAMIINSLNIIFDLTKHLYARKKRNPNVDIFYSFANHLTFEKEFAKSYFNENNINKNDLLDSIYWHLGLFFANSKFI